MAQTGNKKVFDNRFEIMSIVGRGSQSVVYHARLIDQPSNELALKVLLDKKQDQGSQQSNSAMLQKEALALVSSRHKNVIRLDDFHANEEIAYLSLEYAPEADLRKYVSKYGKLTVLQLERFIMQISDALHFIHNAGITHRDIKPDNILTISDRQVKLGDFGVAVMPGEESSLDSLKSGIGTLDYMAPEVLMGNRYDARSDIYSLGVTFYELISGSHPFAGAPLAEQLNVRQDPSVTPLHEIVPQIPEYLCNVVMQAMKFDANDRFSNAKELSQSLIVNKQNDEELSPDTDTSTAGSIDKTQFVNPQTVKDFIEQDSAEIQAAKEEVSNPEEEQLVQDTQEEEVLPHETTEQDDTPAETSENPPEEEPAQSVTDTFSPAGTVSLSAEEALKLKQKLEERAPGATAKTLTVDFSPEEAANLKKQLNNPVTAPEDREEKHTEESFNPQDVFDLSESTEHNPQDSLRKTVSTSKNNNKNKKKNLPQPIFPKEHTDEADRKQYYMTLSIAMVLLGMMTFYGGDLNYYVKKNFNIDIAGSFKSAIGLNNSPGSQPVPEVQINYPYLEEGMYTGVISGLMPGKTVPLVMVSYPKFNEIIIIVAIEGWTPVVTSPEHLQKKNNRGPLMNNNGFIYEFSGDSSGGSVEGTIKNKITGENGQWNLKKQ